MAEISPLRQRMMDDLKIRNLSAETQRSYIHHVSRFSRYFGRSPDKLGIEDVRAYPPPRSRHGPAHYPGSARP
ncbi:phage integrase N-terminal SAM-like domain-containing protein [Asticcacaulis sp.]|uniref:phage integrase N-terminal SAM-like domain-containing protein n=1 Tax=Asticcacaulis sp. TaxID=1872648 RepID=UPI003457F681